jgi:hypothetical protein
MPKKRIDIQLTQDERDELEKFISQGKKVRAPSIAHVFFCSRMKAKTPQKW